MRIILAEELVDEITRADCADALHSALAIATRRMGFRHFALSYDRCAREMPHPALLVHDYPDEWARTYVSFNLGGRDPVRRACEKTMTGFAWKQLDRLIPLTRGDRQMLTIGRENGIGDGYTVPRHLPGEASGSCTFVVGPDMCLPHSMLHVAELVGAFGLASARRMTCPPVPQTKPVLSERQRECVLWSARGKTAAEVAIIMGISEDTVIQHLKLARERYDVHSRVSLVLCALFDGLIGFSDIFRWRGRC